MMLDTDMCLAYRHSQNNNGVNEFLLASQSKCCGWSNGPGLFGRNVLVTGQQNDVCGLSITGPAGQSERAACCGNTSGPDCDSARNPTGPAYASVADFAASESSFYTSYL